MLPDFVLARAQELSHGACASVDESAAGDVRTLRRNLVDVLGISRIPRTSGVAVVDRVEWRDYAVEKLVFEATPGLPIPAHLYLPRDGDRHAAVVHAPGHWMEDAKLAPDVQRLNVSLARGGVAVLCYDTIGQGERRVGWHQHGQLAPLLTGFTTLGLMVKDSLAGLDLLASRAEVDSERLGMVGASGGGFSTIFAAAIDPRVRAAAIGCIVNTHVGQIRDAAFGTGWDSWVDLCNQVPRLCSVGSVGQILSAICPRALLVANAEDDPSIPLAGARSIAEEVNRAYRTDAAAQFSYVEVPGGHGLHSQMRRTLAGFLLGHLGAGEPVRDDDHLPFSPQWAVTHEVGRADRPQTTVPLASRGTCLPTPTDCNGPVVELARARANTLRRQREPLTLDRLAAAVGPFPERTPLNARVTNHLVTPQGAAQRLTLSSEPGIELDCLFMLPPSWDDVAPPVVVILDEGGKSQALQSPDVTSARDQGFAVLLPDLRGTGESAASEFEVSTAAWMLDRDLLNQRVWDVLRLVDFLSERYSTGQQVDKGRIALWGMDAFGIVALVAGALDPRVAAVGATGITSLEELLVQSPTVTPMAYSYRMLETLDLPDLRRLAHPRPMSIGVGESDVPLVMAELAGRMAGKPGAFPYP